MNRQRIGLFGGTFDPPHLAHLLLASEAAYQFDLSRVLWVLTPNPPHKDNDPITALEHRLALIHLTIADNPIFELSRLELDRPGPHFSVDTVKLLAAQDPNADITLLIGGDSLHDFPTWRSPSDLVTAVHQIGVMHRPGDSVDLPALEEHIPGLTEKVRFVDTLLQDISSTEIRRRIRNGEPYRYYVLPSVYEYIVEHRLYQD
ncbi:MAG: nicotinate-nucleotide adenylyltransferase [Chloroflexota bacterium]